MESIFFFFGTKIENIKLGIFIEVYPTVSELSYNFKALHYLSGIKFDSNKFGPS